MNTIEIRKMSTIERLQAMEALWDSLLYEESEIESPEWHRDILEERKRKIENGKTEFISLEELKASRKSCDTLMHLIRQSTATFRNGYSKNRPELSNSMKTRWNGCA